LKRHPPLLRAAASLILLVTALALLFSVYRHVRTPIQLLRNAITVEGRITEKRVSTRGVIPVYTVRYVYPSPYGALRSGEQVVTRGFLRSLGEQGSPLPVRVSLGDHGLSAADSRLVFPGMAGIRLAAAVVLMLAAIVLVPLKWRQADPPQEN